MGANNLPGPQQPCSTPRLLAGKLSLTSQHTHEIRLLLHHAAWSPQSRHDTLQWRPVVNICHPTISTPTRRSRTLHLASWLSFTRTSSPTLTPQLAHVAFQSLLGLAQADTQKKYKALSLVLNHSCCCSSLLAQVAVLA